MMPFFGWRYIHGFAIWKYDLFAINPATAANNIVSTMSDIFILLDPGGKILSINRALTDLLGYHERDITDLTGLDIEIMRAVCIEAGYHVIFEEISWTENLKAVRDGRLDFGLAVTPEAGRRRWAWFTIPYRKEPIVAFKGGGPASGPSLPFSRCKAALKPETCNPSKKEIIKDVKGWETKFCNKMHT